MAEKFINGDLENTKQQQIATIGEREEEEEDEDEDEGDLSMEDNNVDFVWENNVDWAREDNDAAVVNEYEETPGAYLQRLANDNTSSEKNRESIPLPVNNA